ncbi:protein KBP homolog [Temnothorax curvispinosus]|uniref:KIF-binding protein n=1 Tax=Temnothorax curvispinosus TaxID=300111 RepID=A0A6J1PVM5_9HYME|nr:protein KBP homolog [Temnothorax curvispinosus]
MLAFLRQTMERRREFLRFEAKPSESAESMDISEEFLEIVQLSFDAKELSKIGEPSKEKNKMINELQIRMDILLHNIDIQADAKFDDVVVLAVAFYNWGLVYVNSKEDYELHIALKFFETCLHLLRNKELDRKAILTSIGALNEINSIFVKLEKNNYIFHTSKSPMELYLEYTKEDNYLDPIHIPIIVGIKEKESSPRIILEELHFKSLCDIANQYLIQPENKHDGFITYMYNLLKKHLSETISEGRQFREDCFNWVSTLFDISRYFLLNNRFAEARNHLATADYVIQRFSEETLKTINQQNEVSRLRFLYLSDSYDYVCGVSARSWGTYGVLLLRFWRERFLQSKDKNCDVDNSKLGIKSWEDSSLLIFSDVEKETECITNQITHTRVLNLADAKSVFTKILNHLDAAKEYFTADTDIENYAKIMLDVSAAYKYLAGFEQGRDVQLKLHKRRVEFLEDVCKKFHTIIDTEFVTYKRVWCEVVIACSTVMDLMLEETYHDESKIMSKEVDRYAKLILGNIDLYLHVA